MEVYDDPEDENCGHEVHDVGEVLPVECLAQGPDLVLSGGEQVEEGDDGALELGTAPSVDRGGREALPDDGLADVGGDEQRYSRAKTWGGNISEELHIAGKSLLPYPFCSSSSSRRTIRPATNSWMMIRRQTPAPMSLGSPYIPVRT